MSTADEIIGIFCEIEDFKAMKRLLEELLTPAEIKDIALRWRLMKMLHNQVPQRQIASKLGVSLCKITRGSRVLKARGSVTKRILISKSGDNNAIIKPTPSGTQR